MHRHRRPGWRRRRLLSDIEAMHRQSAQIVRTELLAPGFVKQHRTAPRACSRWQAGSASDDAGYAANRRSGSLILLAYLAPRYSVAEVGCNVSDVVLGPFTLGRYGLFPVLQRLEKAQIVTGERPVSAQIIEVGAECGPEHRRRFRP